MDTTLGWPDLYPHEQGWGGLARRRAFFHFDFGVACGWDGCPKVRDMWLRGYAADVWMLFGTVAIGVGVGFVAGPFPANFLCFQVGGGTEGLCDKTAGKIYTHNAACSVPASAGKSTTFSCTADYGAIPDGNVWACAIAADASIPDNPSGSDQTSTADEANLSDASCDGVVLDRTPPTVAIGAASASVKVGDLVSFQASASDAVSGLAGVGQWTWGDNTGGGNGDAVTHTYTQAGTYEITLTATAACVLATSSCSLARSLPRATLTAKPAARRP